MGGQINPKVLGATIIGLALVAGAYVVTNFGEPSKTYQVASTPTASHQPRVVIAVSDNDENGIEDWRDSLVDTEAIIRETPTTTTYVPPTTLTGKTGVNFIEGIIESKIYNPIAPSSGEVLNRTVQSLERAVAFNLYDTKDIDVMEEWVDQDIVNYANTFANVIYLNDTVETGFELDIVDKVFRNSESDGLPAGVNELKVIRDIYTGTKDDALKIPVPKILAKEHLDLINTINALAEDVNGMSQTADDPLLSLIHIRRYEGDAEGLAIALRNMYTALEEHSELFSVEDPALFFATFSPDYRP